MRVFILKPDAIGDFILSTGCIRLMARELGEKNLAMAVRADVAPLAMAQFPEAEVIPLHLREKRRFVNLATVNVINCLPAWLRLLTLRADAAICLRSSVSRMSDALLSSVYPTFRWKRIGAEVT